MQTTPKRLLLALEPELLQSSMYRFLLADGRFRVCGLSEVGDDADFDAAILTSDLPVRAKVVALVDSLADRIEFRRDGVIAQATFSSLAWFADVLGGSADHDPFRTTGVDPGERGELTR